jgi:hypothetical protein
MTTKLLTAVDEIGNLCAYVLTSGSLHDQTAVRQMIDAFRDIHFVGDNQLTILKRDARGRVGVVFAQEADPTLATSI